MSALVQTSYANETTPYFALANASGGASVSNWSTFPAVSTINASGNAITNVSSLQIDAQVLTANASELFLNGVPIATISDISNVSDWALYPSLANINANNFAISNVSGFELDGNQVSTLGDTILVNGLNPVSNWSSYTAGTNVNLGGNGISNVSGFQLDGAAISTDGLFVYVDGQNPVERWSQFAAIGIVNLSGNDIINVDQIDASGVSAVDAYINNLYVYTPDNMSSAIVTSTNSGATLLLNSVPLLTAADISSAANWATYPAVANVNMSGFTISNTPTISISGNTQNVVLTASGTSLFVDGQPVFTGVLPPSDVSNWSLYPAVSDVNMSGHNILGNGDLGISANNISLAAASNIYITQNATTRSIAMTGNITQCNAGAGSNFFQSGVQVGSSGVLPTDQFGTMFVYGGNVPVGLSTLYVKGGCTLDGTLVHGHTIGCLPAAGINTQRIDVLPVGILLTSPTFITMNGLGAANIAMGGAVAIAAGSYVTLEHGTGLGQNGVFVQNTARDSNARLVMTGGGTLYNATEVQASNIVNPNGVRFYNGVYNPSGGSIIVPPVYGRAVIDLSSASSYLATLTGGDLPATKNTNSVFIGNLTNLSTGGVSSTIAIGNLSGMTRQSEFAIAMGFRAGLSGQQSAAIAIGASAGSNNQGGDGIAIGAGAGFTNQGGNSVAVGSGAGTTSLGSNSVAIGLVAGSNALGSNSVAIGAEAGKTGSGTSVVAIGYRAGSNNLGSNSIAIGALSATGGMGEFSTYIGTANTIEGAVGTNTIVLNNTGLAMNPANNNAFYVGKITSQASAPGFNMVAHNNGTGEFIQTLTSSLSMDSTISNTQQVSYDTGLLRTTIDGQFKVNGGAEFTQAVTCDTTLEVGNALNYVDTAVITAGGDKNGFLQGVLVQNICGGANASTNVVCVNDSAGTDYVAMGINSSTFSNVYNTLFERPNTSYFSGTADTAIGSQSDHSQTSSLFLTYQSGEKGFCINSSGALSMNASISGGSVYKGNFGISGQLLVSTGSDAPPVWSTASSAVGLISAANTFWVAENGLDVSGGGQCYAPFKTIQFAINQCTAGAQDNGQTIWVMAGLYVENLTIANKNINIRGSGDANHTYNTTIRGNMTITSSNSARSYRTISFQDIQIQNYTATTGTAITLSTTGTGKGKLVLNGCYVIGASTGVSLLDATATNCDWIVACDATRFYTSFAYSAPLINIGGNQGTACIMTLNQCLVEYESPAGSTNSIIKVNSYSGLTTTYSTITQPLNGSLNNSALTNGLVWVANLPNSGVVASSTNGVSIGTTLLFSGTQATLGVAGTTAMFIERGCPSVYLIGGTLSVRSNSTPATHAIVGSPTGVTKTILYFNTSNMMTTRGSANKADATNLTITALIALT